MVGGIVACAQALRDALSVFEPGLLSGEDCASLAEQLAVTEKACAGARARAALRAAQCGAHEKKGFADAVDWLARAAGSSTGSARTTLQTASELERCPPAKEALLAGDLSVDQAAAITSTESECPGSEAGLVDLARRSSLATLREEARKRRMEAVNPEELHSRQHRARAVRHWRDQHGMVCLRAELPPQTGVGLVNPLDAETDRIARAARREGRPEARAAHAADALVNLLTGKAGSKAKGAEVVIVCDLNSYQRGEARSGEVSHIVGGGPLPVWAVRRQAKDAFVKAVLHDGVRIHTVAHYGRHIPAELRTALELGPVPAFDGARCVEDGCGRRHGLEWDHVNPVANGGATSYDNLKARCWPHHQAKTERDREAGLFRVAARAGAPP